MTDFINGFKNFALRGRVLDFAVAIVAGLAFKEVVDVFTSGILLTFVAAIFGEPSIASVTVDVGDGRLLVGAFLDAGVAFVIVAFALHLVIRTYGDLQRRREAGEVAHDEVRSEELVVMERIDAGIQELVRRAG